MKNIRKQKLQIFFVLFLKRFKDLEQEGAASLLEQLEKEMEEEKKEEEQRSDEKETPRLSVSSVTNEGSELSELEEELQKEEEIRLLHEQNTLLEEVIVINDF